MHSPAFIFEEKLIPRKIYTRNEFFRGGALGHIREALFGQDEEVR